MITVIADDVTGAAEIAGICLRYGISVAFGIDAFPNKTATVTVIATDSRSCTEKEAFTTHQQLAKNSIANNTSQIIFKKCDSVLRGHILAELAAIGSILKKEHFLLQPANPTTQRCIQNGFYYVNGKKIEETEFSTDPDFPAIDSNINNLILKRAKQKYSVNKVFSGTIKNTNTPGIYVPDCSTENDAFYCLSLNTKNSIIGGSAWFFEQFLIKKNLISTTKTTTPIRIKKRYILVSGSTHPNSISFSQKLQQHNCPTLLFPEELLLKESSTEALNNWIQKSITTYSKNKKISLRISNKLVQFTNSSHLLKQRLSTIVYNLLQATETQELFIEGGATTYDVLKKLNWKTFTPIAELAPGVIRMQYSNTNKHITIKPGSYPWPNGILR